MKKEKVIESDDAVPLLGETLNFGLDKKATKAFREFEKHNCPLKGKTGAIGGCMKVVFTGTGLGYFADAVCDCGRTESLTDLDAF